MTSRAAYWQDEVTRARKAEACATVYADRIADRQPVPGNDIEATLYADLAQAARATAMAWAAYAYAAEQRFTDWAESEMFAANLADVLAWRMPEQAERRHRHDGGAA